MSRGGFGGGRGGGFGDRRGGGGGRGFGGGGGFGGDRRGGGGNVSIYKLKKCNAYKTNTKASPQKTINPGLIFFSFFLLT